MIIEKRREDEGITFRFAALEDFKRRSVVC
jgi:hypothetical protein